MNEDKRTVQKMMGTVKLIFHSVHSDLEEVGLHRGQPGLLFSLWEKDGQSKKELSQNMVRKAATVTKMVGRLENNGIVRTKQDDLDSRISRVFLTEKGRSLEVPVREIFDGLEADVMAGFSQEEIDQLNDYMMRIKENILHKNELSSKKEKMNETDV